jgi:AsmA family
MKKILGAGCALVLLVVLVLAGAFAYFVSRLDTPELKQSLLEQAKATLGTELRVKEMKISLFEGVTLKAIAVKNPAPFPGQLLTADAFVLRYRLLPLLAGRMEVERLALEKPALALAMDTKGTFNYEKLGRTAAAKAAPAASSPAAASATPLRVVMKSLAVDDGSIVMTDYAKARLMAVDAIDFESAFEVAGGIALGAGQVTIGKANFGDVLFVKGVRAPLSMSKEKLTLSPIKGDVAGGSISGDLNVDLKGFRYTTQMAVKGASVKTLLEEARSTPFVTGTLSATARFDGSGGLPTIRGEGSADISSCRAQNSKVLGLLASVLQVPELANPDFEACHVEFKQTGSRFATPVVKLTGDAVRLSGQGSVNLDSRALDYDMSLALSPKLFAKLTRPELRGAFQPQADGFQSVAFKLTGTTLEPKTDLLSRVGKAAATSAVKDAIGRLFKKKTP